jgi:excisionase family DNA binding protein
VQTACVFAWLGASAPVFNAREEYEMEPTTATGERALLLTAGNLAQLLNISVRTLWRLRAQHKIPAPIRVGGSVRWRTRDIEAWIAKGCPAIRH